LSTEPKRRSSINPVAWMASGEIDYHDWVFEGRRIGAMGRGSPWWVGDWLLYGTARWGERYTEAVKITGYDGKSLRNMRYVASSFDLSLRRDILSWSHHALLAAFDPDEQKHWLDRAVADKLSVDDLRVELRSARRGGYSTSSHEDESPCVSEEATEVVCPACGHEFRPPSQ
jgi:hypothetical protein